MIITNVEEKNNTVIVSMNGELSLNSIEEFDDAFKKYLNSSPTVVALDLEHVPYLNSFGISRIIKISRAFADKGIEFVLINMNENIYQIFRMSTFDKIFNILTLEEFNRKYFPLERPAKQPDAGTKKGDSNPVNEHKMKQVEVTDDNGTTLVFIDED